MALPVSPNPISFNNVNQELGRQSPYNQTVALNDSVVRTLFGKASGAIAMSDGWGKSNYTPYQNMVVFNFGSGTYQNTWTVPSNLPVTSILVKAWGCGGANSGQSGVGGGGGFISGYLPVSAGQIIYMDASDGYLPGWRTRNADCFGCPDYPCQGDRFDAEGGRAIRIYKPAVTPNYMIVGGGGAGAATNNGGTGGGTNGGNGGGSSPSFGYGATGGTGGAGSTYFSVTTYRNGGPYAGQTLGTSFGMGGVPKEGLQCENEGYPQDNYYGAWGGDGWAGGGAGWWPGGSGGGSSGSSGAWTGVTNLSASGRTPGGVSDSDWYGNVGYGAAANAYNGQPPAHGRVIIRY